MAENEQNPESVEQPKAAPKPKPKRSNKRPTALEIAARNGRVG